MKKISNFDERLESEQVLIEGLLDYKYSDYLKEESYKLIAGDRVATCNYLAEDDCFETTVSMNALGDLCVENYSRDSDARVVGTLRGTDNLAALNIKSNGISCTMKVLDSLTTLDSGKWTFMRYQDNTTIRYSSSHDSISGNDSKVNVFFNLDDNDKLQYIDFWISSNLMDDVSTRVRIDLAGITIADFNRRGITTSVDPRFMNMHRNMILKELRKIKVTAPLIGEDEEILESIIQTLIASVKENSLDSSYLEISKLKDKQRRILDIVNNNLFDLMIPSLYKELRDASNRYYSKICDGKELKLD